LIDYSRQGKRFQVKPGIVTYAYKFKCEQGTIIAEYENNVGRRIVSCQIDGLGATILFAEEIEMIEDHRDA
jgi:hypothetical protein